MVATPIGNLEDMTYRAVRVLREVDRIACEDTRVTRRLCDHFGVEATLLRHEAHNEASSTEGILALLAEGASVALVSDAGTPCINDPGQRLIASAIGAGHPVVPVPGASSLIVALSASGLPTERFTFHGFVPKKAQERATVLSTLSRGTHALFCPARDLPGVVEALAGAQSDADVVVAREMTKVHETWYRGKAPALAAELRDASLKGEAVILVHIAPAAQDVSDRDIMRRLVPLLEGGVRAKAAATQVAQELGVSKRRVYQLSLKV